MLWGISVKDRLSNVLRSHCVHIILILFIALAWSKLCLVNLLCLESQKSSSLTVRKKKVYLDFCVFGWTFFSFPKLEQADSVSLLKALLYCG